MDTIKQLMRKPTCFLAKQIILNAFQLTTGIYLLLTFCAVSIVLQEINTNYNLIGVVIKELPDKYRATIDISCTNISSGICRQHMHYLDQQQ